MKFSDATTRILALRALLCLVILSMVLAACGTDTATPTVIPAPAATATTATSGSTTQVTATTGSAATEPTATMAAATGSVDAKGILTIGREGTTTYTRNFNPFSPTALWGTTTAIYERMMIANRATGKLTPWLATKYEGSADGLSLTFTLQPNVKWSDGQAFTSADVVYTFNLLKKSFAGGGFADFLGGVEAVDPTTVKFKFSRVYSPGLYQIAEQIIVPEHIWKDVADPVNFTNDNPVGTGPFTDVAVFQPQVFELHRNPNYWQAGKPYIEGIRYPAYPANEQVSLALISGEIDWADIFQPDVEQTFVAKDPAHNSYWFPTTSNTIQLTLNTTKAPFNDVVVRKAISMAIDRNQISTIAMSGYTHPSDSTGLSDAYTAWKNPAALALDDWTTRNVVKANKMLDDAGYTKGANGIRLNKDGSPMKYEIIVNAPSSDWVSSSQIIAQNLKDIGMEVTAKPIDGGVLVDSLQKGNFDMAHAWSGHGATPYEFYRSEMSCDYAKPIGQVTNENFHRYCNQDATNLLHQFEGTFDEAKQKDIVNQLQMIFVKEAPEPVLFPSPQWGEVNNTRFTDFPSKENPYALLESRLSSAVIVLTTVKPR